MGRTLVFLAVFSLAACSKVNVEDRDSGTSNRLGAINTNQSDFENTFETVADKCKGAQLEEQPVTLDFPEQLVKDPFSLPGNGPARNEYFMSRLEQIQEVVIPQLGTVCGLELSVTTASNKFQYDDHFLFLLDNTPIAYSYEFGSLLAKGPFGLEFDWEKIHGQFWDPKKEGVFCLGQNEGMSQCSWPHTDVEGKVNLTFSNELIQKVFALRGASNKNPIRFRFVAVGDNDQYDSWHTALQMKAKLLLAR